MKKGKLIVITGPTASGKSALAVEKAQTLGTEIISADSRQVYRDIPIVTAQPTQLQLAAVTHHLVGCFPLDRYYSAARFEEDALAIARKLIEERGSAVVCGGSMLYIDALCRGIDDLPEIPESIRSGLKEEFDEKGEEWLLSELDRVDPRYAAVVDRRNLKRVFHAIEITRASGSPYSSLRTGKKVSREFEIERITLDLPRDVLFDRINRRVVQMMDSGLLDEARSVYPLRGLNSLNTVGLKELFAHFDGLMSLDEAVARIQKNTRVYAKKQMTWWKRSQ